MEAYTSFAQVYDLFMDNVPYENWCQWISEILKKEGISDGLILDLGCGTGKLTRLLAKKGYDMIGVDMSYEMLEIARENQEDLGILYLQQDMREFELFGTVRAIISACDCLNYIMDDDDVVTVFELVNNYLDPGGLFIFDINTPYKYEELLGNNTFAETREESSFIWNNYYDPEDEVNEYDLTLFCKEEDGRFVRFEEQHFQRCYSLELIQELLAEAGMTFVAAYDAYTNEPVRADSEKITILAREKKTDKKVYVSPEEFVAEEDYAADNQIVK